jgi:hypothetical protein
MIPTCRNLTTAINPTALSAAAGVVRGGHRGDNGGPGRSCGDLCGGVRFLGRFTHLSGRFADSKKFGGFINRQNLLNPTSGFSLRDLRGVRPRARPRGAFRGAKWQLACSACNTAPVGRPLGN